MDRRFIVFDVETPNRYNNRMCAIGITVVEGLEIVDSLCSLINPLQPFDWFNTQLTGINEESVCDAPTFSELWPTIEPILSSGILAAHNAGFDMRVLRSCIRDYEIEWKDKVKGVCTVLMGRKLLPDIRHRLNDLCDFYGIELHHHQADSDSRACAEILIRYMEAGADPTEYVRTYSMI
ncbi:MAG: 3'-5' exonuclease [Oscillospiraceae bacterium]|nr:3'-5' exonuclease [Oscillospiraceae bacterium]